MCWEETRERENKDDDDDDEEKTGPLRLASTRGPMCLPEGLNQ